MNMNSLAYNEPYRISSGFLTLVMHALFFLALYLGVNWRAHQPEGMEVELWSELPAPAAPAAPPAVIHPPTPEQVKPAEKPLPAAKAEIALPTKKKVEEAKKAKAKAKPEKKKKLTQAEQQQASQDILAMEKEANTVTRQQLEANQERAAQQAKARAASDSEIGKYKGLIQAKIRSKIVMPPDVPETALAIFDVTLLPDGSVLDKKLLKSSGNTAYDNEVERAILKAQPLPLPRDDATRERFINPNHLKLKFSPHDGE